MFNFLMSSSTTLLQVLHGLPTGFPTSTSSSITSLSMLFSVSNKLWLSFQHHHNHHYLLRLTSPVSHSWGWTSFKLPPLLSILCHIFHDLQLPHVFFHYLTPGLPWPTYWPSTFHLQLHHLPKYAILIPTFTLTNHRNLVFLNLCSTRFSKPYFLLTSELS